MPNNTAPNSAGDYEYELSEYIKDKNNFDDDDGDDKEGATAEGKLTLTIKDRFGNKVKYEDYYDSCLAPYGYTLSLTQSKLSTKYGAPNTRDYPKASKTHYFINKNQDIKSCYVQPKSTTVLEFNGEKGIRSDWQADKTGFKIVSDADLNLNFPKTGFDDAQFTIALPVGANFDNLTFTKNGDTNVTLDLAKINLSEKQQGALVTIKGANKANPQTFTPTTFTINADGKNLYSFKLNKWFILDSDSKGSIKDAMSYCFDLPDYRLINLHDITNGHLFADAKGALFDASPAWSKDGFARAIGDGSQDYISKGSLTAEWGDITSYGYANNWMATSTQRSQNLNDYVSVKLTKGEQTTHTLSAIVVAKACVSDGENLFAVKLPDGMIYHRGNNPSTAQNPIELAEGKTFADVNIKDGVTIKITDLNGKNVARNQALTACDAPYKLSLSKDGASVDYYFKSPGVQACYAQSDFDKKNSNDTTIGNGYKIVNAESVEANFPTTGFNNANFRLSLAGITNENVTIVKDFGADSVTASLFKDSDNVVGIILDGPTHANQKEFKPTQFTVYGDAAKTIKLYSFKLTKWFISSPNRMRLSDAQNYCLGLPNYRLADARELTNATAHGEAVVEGWTENKFKRAIGGGLFAEWNDAGAYDSSKNNFVQDRIYWSSSYYANTTGHFADVSSSIGWIGNANNDEKFNYQRAACVSDGNVVNKPKVAYARTYVDMNNNSNSWEWVQDKGYKVYNIDVPAGNFPRTGFNNARFELKLENVISAGVNVVKEAGGDETLTSGAWVKDKSIVGIWLNGVRYDRMFAFKPTQFTVYADTAKTIKLYSFKITKWFVAAPNSSNLLAAQEYCASLPNYRLARTDELTNASRSDYGIVGNVGTAKINWDNNHFNRAIGDGGTDTGWRGGLMAEWGSLYI